MSQREYSQAMDIDSEGIVNNAHQADPAEALVAANRATEAANKKNIKPKGKTQQGESSLPDTTENNHHSAPQGDCSKAGPAVPEHTANIETSTTHGPPKAPAAPRTSSTQVKTGVDPQDQGRMIFICNNCLESNGLSPPSGQSNSSTAPSTTSDSSGWSIRGVYRSIVPSREMKLEQEVKRLEKDLKAFCDANASISRENERLKSALKAEQEKVDDLKDATFARIHTTHIKTLSDDAARGELKKKYVDSLASWCKKANIKAWPEDFDFQAVEDTLRAKTASRSLLSLQEGLKLPPVKIVHAYLSEMIWIRILMNPFYLIDAILAIRGNGAASSQNQVLPPSAQFKEVCAYLKSGDEETGHKWRAETIMTVKSMIYKDDYFEESFRQVLFDHLLPLVQDFYESPVGALLHKDTESSNDLAHILLDIVDMSIKFWTQKSYITATDPLELAKRDFDPERMELDPFHKCLEDEVASYKGSRIVLVTQPEISCVGAQDGGLYHHSKIWCKARVIVSGSPRKK